MVLSGNQATLRDIGVWGGAIIPLLFVVQYTLLARWWRNATGRALVALDTCIWLTLTPRALALAWPSDGMLDVMTWVTEVAFACVPLTIIYRMFAFEVMRRRERRKRRLFLVAELRSNVYPYRYPGQSSGLHGAP